MTSASLAVFLEANQAAQFAMGVRDAANPWAGSPFEWILALPSRTRGKAGEKLVEAWLTRLGYECRPPASSQYDLDVAGRHVEVKFSTLWKSGRYVFQQLRHQDYQFAFLLGISPDDASAWFVPKELALKVATPQHGGSSGTDTRWLRFPAGSPPVALRAYGGSLDDAAETLRQTLR